MCLVSGHCISLQGRLKAQVNKGNNGGSSWIQLLPFCELVIRYSVRKKKFVLEVSETEPKVALKQHDHQMLKQSALSNELPLVNKKQRKFNFEISYQMGGFSTNSSKQAKQVKQLGMQIGIEPTQEHIASLLT